MNIPLNYDSWTDLTIGLTNSPTFVTSRGTLDAQGQGGTQIKAGQINLPSVVGTILYHAAIVFDGSGVIHAATNPVTLLIEK